MFWWTVVQVDKVHYSKNSHSAVGGAVPPILMKIIEIQVNLVYN
jgi:hypothetical protein